MRCCKMCRGIETFIPLYVSREDFEKTLKFVAWKSIDATPRHAYFPPLSQLVTFDDVWPVIKDGFAGVELMEDRLSAVDAWEKPELLLVDPKNDERIYVGVRKLTRKAIEDFPLTAFVHLFDGDMARIRLVKHESRRTDL